MLRRAGAPAELVRWVEQAGAEDAWDGCDRGDWLVWMAACRGAPLDGVTRVALDAVTEVRRGFAETGDGALDRVLHAAATGHLEDLEDHAEALDTLGEGGPQSYRRGMAAGYPAVARATASIARSREALGAARAALEARAAQDALFRAVGIGVAPSLMHREIGPLYLQPDAAGDPLQEELAYAVDAAAEALVEGARALAGEDADRLEEAEAEISDRIFEPLEALVSTG